MCTTQGQATNQSIHQQLLGPRNGNMTISGHPLMCPRPPPCLVTSAHPLTCPTTVLTPNSIDLFCLLRSL